MVKKKTPSRSASVNRLVPPATHILQCRESVVIVVLVSSFDDLAAVLNRVEVNVELDLALPSGYSNLRVGGVRVWNRWPVLIPVVGRAAFDLKFGGRWIWCRDAGTVLSRFGIGFLNTSFTTSANVSAPGGLSYCCVQGESREDRLLFYAH